MNYLFVCDNKSVFLFDMIYDRIRVKHEKDPYWGGRNETDPDLKHSLTQFINLSGPLVLP